MSEVKEAVALVYKVLSSMDETLTGIKLVLIEQNEERLRRESALESGITRLAAETSELRERVKILELRSGTTQ